MSKRWVQGRGRGGAGVGGGTWVCSLKDMMLAARARVPVSAACYKKAKQGAREDDESASKVLGRTTRAHHACCKQRAGAPPQSSTPDPQLYTLNLQSSTPHHQPKPLNHHL